MDDTKLRCTDDSPDVFDMAANDSGLDIDSVDKIIKEKKNRVKKLRGGAKNKVM